MDSLELAVAPGEVPDFDCRLAFFHCVLLGVVLDDCSSSEASSPIKNSGCRR
jgi:hypothetical protein